MKQLTEYLSRMWCRMAHPEPMWPVNGYYRCPVCLRIHAVPWERAKHSRRPLADGVANVPALAAPRR
jgi:hypothetical protein